ncbi:hypothetical protein V2J09_013255 [Rumex salicifolius]
MASPCRLPARVRTKMASKCKSQRESPSLTPSIGSLGKESIEAGVQNVTIKTVVFTRTENGVRMKSWARPSTSYVRSVLFQHATMVSGVRISDITYDDIHGSSATPIVVKFDCSSEYPCANIRMDYVKLTYDNKVARSSCANAGGLVYGVTQPSTCF